MTIEKKHMKNVLVTYLFLKIFFEAFLQHGEAGVFSSVILKSNIKWGLEGGKEKGGGKCPPPKKKFALPPNFCFTAIFFLLDKSRNLFQFVSVLLSASVERVGVSRIRDFFD